MKSKIDKSLLRTAITAFNTRREKSFWHWKFENSNNLHSPYYNENYRISVVGHPDICIGFLASYGMGAYYGRHAKRGYPEISDIVVWYNGEKIYLDLKFSLAVYRIKCSIMDTIIRRIDEMRAAHITDTNRSITRFNNLF